MRHRPVEVGTGRRKNVLLGLCGVDVALYMNITSDPDSLGAGLHVGKSVAAAVMEQFKMIEKLKTELAAVRNEVDGLKQQVFSVAYQQHRLPAAVHKLEPCFMDQDHLPAAFKKDSHALCANCYHEITDLP